MRAFSACLLLCACDQVMQVDVAGDPVDVTMEAQMPALPPQGMELRQVVRLQVPSAEQAADALAGLTVQIDILDVRDSATDRDLGLASWPRVELWLAGERLLGSAELAALAAGKAVRHTFSDAVVTMVREHVQRGQPVDAELRLGILPPAQMPATSVRCRIRLQPIYTVDLLGAL